MSTAKPAGSAGHNDSTTDPHELAEDDPTFDRGFDRNTEGSFLPVAPAGMSYGYARVSRGDSQTLDRQLTELAAAGAVRVFTDEISGGKATASRPGFSNLVSHLRSGDQITVVSLDRLSRSLADLIATLEDLVENRGVTIRVLWGSVPSTRTHP